MDSNITKNLHWSSSPLAYMERAKARALATLDDPAPALTALEQGYREVLLKTRQA
jgi:hypothetical protein